MAETLAQAAHPERLERPSGKHQQRGGGGEIGVE
jgi:hypothetical protein